MKLKLEHEGFEAEVTYELAHDQWHATSKYGDCSAPNLEMLKAEFEELVDKMRAHGACGSQTIGLAKNVYTNLDGDNIALIDINGDK